MAEIADDSIYSDGAGARKRRRLTHLSPDEKVLRRKLKNRVAAQTARDRKKVLMTELEEQVSLLQEEKKQLLKENAQLRNSHASIQKENHCLKKLISTVATTPNTIVSSDPPSSTPLVVQTSAPTVPCKVEVPDCDTAALPCKTEPDSPRSAAPAVSLPKEQIQALSRVMMQYAACALTLSLMLCFVSWKNASSQKAESSSRKRKQTKPARRPSVNAESTLLMENCQREQSWWGPQQQTWTPSMN
ncbi:hypothetical protein V1264_021244 [Littorina saxatilis]